MRPQPVQNSNPAMTLRIICAALMICLAACALPFSDKAMELDIGFAGGMLWPESLNVLSEPAMLLKSQGCGRQYGFISPPVILSLVYDSKIEVVAPKAPAIQIKKRNLSAHRVEVVHRGSEGRIDMVFIMECEELNGAQLTIGSFTANGRIIDIPPVMFRQSSRRQVEWKPLPSGIPR